MRFLPQPDGGATHEQTLMRLQYARSALPFAERYCSGAIWVLLFGWRPSFDETQKAIPRENLPFQSDVNKNVVWREVLESQYCPDSYYRYLEAWHRFREHALTFGRELTEYLDVLLSGGRARVGKLDSAVRSLAGALAERPDPPQQALKALGDNLGTVSKNWASSYQNFFLQVCDQLKGQVRQDNGRLMVYNFASSAESVG